MISYLDDLLCLKYVGNTKEIRLKYSGNKVEIKRES
jgi:hypothetical protein